MSKDKVFILGLALIFLVLIIVGSMEYQDEKQELQTYCKNVQRGSWPDYKGIYSRYCKTLPGIAL